MKTILSFACASALLAYAGEAAASHKAWLLKNGATECEFAVPLAQENTFLLDGAPIRNTAGPPAIRDVVCPIALSARWGSSGTRSFAPPRWAAVRSALVYARMSPNGPIACKAALQSSSGILFYSSTVSASGAGVQPVFLADEGHWGAGSALEANKTMTAASLDIICSLPQSGAVFGYKAKICQRTASCHGDGQNPSEQDLSGGKPESQIVQTSGIECSPHYPTETAQRSASGITPGTNGALIFCPIATPSDDSREHDRALRYVKVQYQGGSTASNCVDQGTCPKCRMRWWARNGNFTQGDYFKKGADQVSNRFVWSETAQHKTDYELLAGVDCRVPQGVTLEGVTAWSSTTFISAGD